MAGAKLSPSVIIDTMKETFPQNPKPEDDVKKETVPKVEAAPTEEWRELSPEEEQELRDLIKQLQEREGG